MDQCSIFLRKMKKRTWCLNNVFFQTGKKNKDFFFYFPIIITKAKRSDFHCDLWGMTQCTRAVEFTNLASHLFVFLIFVGSSLALKSFMYGLASIFNFYQFVFSYGLAVATSFGMAGSWWLLYRFGSFGLFPCLVLVDPCGPFQLRLLFYYMFILLYIFLQN